MSKRPGQLLVLICASALFAAGQATAASGPSVPSDEQVYEFLDRLDCLGLLDSRISAIRPMCREEIARLLLEASDNADINPIATAAIKGEIARHLRRYRAEVSYIERSDAGEGESYIKPFQGLSASYINRKGDPQIERQSGRDMYEGGSVLARGSAHGRLLDFLTFNIDFEVLYNSGEAPAGEDETTVRIPHTGVKISALNVDIYGGYDSVVWGPQGHDSLLMSENPEPFKLLKISNPQPVLLPWIFSCIGPLKYELFFTELEGAKYRVVPHPFLAGMKVSARPVPWIEVGVSRTFMFDGESVEKPDAHDIFRILLGYEESDHRGRPDIADQRTGVDGRIRLTLPWAGAALYWEAFGENVSSLVPYRWSTRVGLHVATVVAGAGFDLRAEWARIHPSAYHSAAYPTGHFYKGYPIGHHAGPDSDDVYLEISSAPASFLRIWAGADWERRRKLSAAGADEERVEFSGGAALNLDGLEGFGISASAKYAKVRNPGRTAGPEEEDVTFSVEVKYEF